METNRPPTRQQRLRAMALMQAYMHFHERRFPRTYRERSCWLLLFMWASYGGNHARDVVGSTLAGGMK